MSPRICLIVGLLSAALSVALGAVGAHAWEATILASEKPSWFDTGIKYMMFHSLGLVLLGIWGRGFVKVNGAKILTTVAILFLAGMVLFSGSLIALALTNNKATWAHFPPFGGSCYILGWLVWAYGASKRREKSEMGE